MIIKIIAGTFGHRVGSRVVAVKAGDDPIEVDDKIGARLIAKGVAVAVGNPQPVAEKSTDEAEEGRESMDFPAFDAAMTRKELEAIALGVGISREAIKAAVKKADLVDLIQKEYEEYQLASDIPTFDAAEAML
jgi:hypothetical protein